MTVPFSLRDTLLRSASSYTVVWLLAGSYPRKTWTVQEESSASDEPSSVDELGEDGMETGMIICVLDVV